MHGEAGPADADLCAGAQSVFVVCFRNTVARGAYPDWSAIDVADTLSNPPAGDPSAILSAKHDTTSWTVGELECIDIMLSAQWQDVLEVTPPGREAGTIHTGDVPAAVGLALRGGCSGPALETHPMWREATERGDEARIRHCGDDIRRHMRLWMEAALERCLTVVVETPRRS